MKAKTKSKKGIAALLLVVMLTAALSGCGKKTPDTVRWFNASYAILTELNGWDYTKFGGLENTKLNNERVKTLLEEWWDVTDRESADETLDWILEEGHRADYLETMELLDMIGAQELNRSELTDFFVEGFEFTNEEADLFAGLYLAYREDEHATDGWDYCRAMNLLGYYYIAGYYTEEEALDKSLEIAKKVQPLFDSWDELVDSYLYGYEYWAEESSAERREIYEKLKKKSDNPYTVDYKTELKKEW